MPHEALCIFFISFCGNCNFFAKARVNTKQNEAALFSKSI